jgi:hypothetical protein
MTMKKWEILLTAAVTLAVGAGVASAKLPPLTDEQKANAAAAAAKGAEAAKKEAELLGKAMDRAAENYKKTHTAKAPMPAAAMPAKGAAKK